MMTIWGWADPPPWRSHGGVGFVIRQGDKDDSDDDSDDDDADDDTDDTDDDDDADDDDYDDDDHNNDSYTAAGAALGASVPVSSSMGTNFVWHNYGPNK